MATKMKTTTQTFLATTAVALVILTPCPASPLTNGGITNSLTRYNSSTSNPYTGSFLAGSTAQVTNGLWSGVLKSAVFRSAAGTLDFLYQVSENANSGAAITKLIDSTFNGYLTDVGCICYDFDGAGSSSVNFMAAQGNKTPLTVMRAADGSTLTYDFGSANAINGSYSSQILVVRTNAVHYATGQTQIFDNAYSRDPFFASLQPYGSGVPEPGTFLCIGLGLLVVSFIRRTRPTIS